MSEFNASHWYQQKVNELSRRTRRAFRNVIKEGEEEVIDNIETRGTEKSGKRGRVESGDMRDAVTSQIISEDSEEIVGMFGWVNAPYYTKFQELGFTHYRSGDAVEGMYALADAETEAIRNLKDEVERIARDV